MTRWIDIDGFTSVFVKDGKVIRATRGNMSSSVYKWDSRHSAYVNVCPIGYSAFIRGYNGGKYVVK